MRCTNTHVRNNKSFFFFFFIFRHGLIAIVHLFERMLEFFVHAQEERKKIRFRWQRDWSRTRAKRREHLRRYWRVYLEWILKRKIPKHNRMSANYTCAGPDRQHCMCCSVLFSFRIVNRILFFFFLWILSETLWFHNDVSLFFSYVCTQKNSTIKMVPDLYNRTSLFPFGQSAFIIDTLERSIFGLFFPQKILKI